MTVRLYIDEDAMDTDFVRALRTRGVDLLTANEAGMVAEPDEHHLRYAAAHGRALLSYNIADYHRIHAVFQANGEPHAGIILVEQTRFPSGSRCAACSSWSRPAPPRRCRTAWSSSPPGGRRAVPHRGPPAAAGDRAAARPIPGRAARQCAATAILTRFW